MNETAEHRLRQWARLPPTEIFAVVATGPVPQIAPIFIRDALTAVVDEGETVGWRLAPAAALHPELLAEFWAWRRRWTTTWSMGPVTNISALAVAATRLATDVGPDLREALEAMCAAETNDQRFGEAHLEPVLMQTGPLTRVLAEVGTDERGGAIIDDLRQSPTSRALVRCWPPAGDDVLLAAAGSTSVFVRPDGLAVVHGDPRSHVFAPVASANLTGDAAIIVDAVGRPLVLSADEARPLGWLAPTSLLWHVESIPLADVWADLLRGLAEAATAATLADTAICFTCDMTHA